MLVSHDLGVGLWGVGGGEGMVGRRDVITPGGFSVDGQSESTLFKKMLWHPIRTACLIYQTSV